MPKIGWKTKLGDLPWVTITLMLLSVFVYAYMRSQVHACLGSRSGQFLVLLLHPIIHLQTTHLVSNIMGLLIGVSAVESWMTLLSRRTRYLILLWSYLLSLNINSGFWIAGLTGEYPSIGASGLFFSATAFAAAYYILLHDHIEYEGLSWLAPVGIGFVLGAFLIPFVSGLAKALIEGGKVIATVELELHVYAVGISFGWALFTLVRKFAVVDGQ